MVVEKLPTSNQDAEDGFNLNNESLKGCLDSPKRKNENDADKLPG